MAPLPSGRTISYFPIRPESSRTTGLDSLWSLMGGRGRARAPALSAGGLARDRELGPAVALPAALVRFVADLDLLAVGDRLQPVGGHPEGHDVVVGALGAPLPEREVVLDGPALVAVPFDRDPDEVESLEHLREGDRAVLGKNAEVPKRFDFVRVTLEGHCGERGTVEYNLALGERRAKGAYDYVVSLGVPADRLKTVSY